MAAVTPNESDGRQNDDLGMGDDAHMDNNFGLSTTRRSDQVAENLTLNFTPIKHTYRPTNTAKSDPTYDKWIDILSW